MSACPLLLYVVVLVIFVAGCLFWLLAYIRFLLVFSFRALRVISYASTCLYPVLPVIFTEIEVRNSSRH